jgi:histidine triad (HIT) family protein
MIDDAAETMAFFPLRPAAVGHTLVIPKRHVDDLWSLDRDTAAVLAEAVLRVGAALRDALRPDGLNVIQSSGAAASQTVFHLHVHLVPRWHDDQFGGIWPGERPPCPADELDDLAASVRAALP